MRKAALGVAAVAALFSAPAFAADMAVKAPPPAPPIATHPWTGCYVGAEGGGGWGRSRHDDLVSGLPDTPYFHVDGGLLGGELGCNYQFSPNWVAGLEGDLSWANLSGSTNDTGIAGTPSFVSTTKEHWVATERLRIGPSWDRLWLYGTVGFAQARIEGDVFDTFFPALFQQTQTEHGWTAGAGLEYALAQNWSVKAEYLYVKLDNKSYIFPAGDSRGALNVSENIFRVGLNWQFGCFGCAVASR